MLFVELTSLHTMSRVSMRMDSHVRFDQLLTLAFVAPFAGNSCHFAMMVSGGEMLTSLSDGTMAAA